MTTLQSELADRLEESARKIGAICSPQDHRIAMLMMEASGILRALAGGEDAGDAARYRHRRLIEVSNQLAADGVMAISPELFKPYLDQYDTTTDELKPEQYDYD